MESIQSTTLRVLVSVGLLSLAASCASPGKPMPLSAGTPAIDVSTGSIALLTLDTENEASPSYHPDVVSVRVRPVLTTEDASGGAEEAGTESRGEWFAAGEAARGAGESYLLSFQLPPGSYEVTNVKGGASAALVYGRFDFPMGLTFELQPNEVAYVGSVRMVNRDRVKGEPRSGSMFPLIDQGVTGFGGGTFDVTLYDAFEQEQGLYALAYPALRGWTVAKRLGRLASSEVDSADAQ